MTFDIVQRFIKSASRLKNLISTKSGDTVNKIKQLLLLLSNEKKRDDSFSYPVLESILSCFPPLRYAHTILEAFDKPVMINVPPILE